MKYTHVRIADGSQKAMQAEADRLCQVFGVAPVRITFNETEANGRMRGIRSGGRSVATHLLGQCIHSKNLIFINERQVESGRIDTFYHEMAHHIAQIKAGSRRVGHGQLWRHYATKLGCSVVAARKMAEWE